VIWVDATKTRYKIQERDRKKEQERNNTRFIYYTGRRIYQVVAVVIENIADRREQLRL